ncbi:hypothetical protein [Paenibacillus chitinolyticus]|uniref:hypothetical protein n=1 Tax=Paenibacillus chitinolyticus TaxID=79263 RepID=UPI0013E96122|nr:hypothetical protein [Paenibacillus chitinolyticus]
MPEGSYEDILYAGLEATTVAFGTSFGGVLGERSQGKLLGLCFLEGKKTSLLRLAGNCLKVSGRPLMRRFCGITPGKLLV